MNLLFRDRRVAVLLSSPGGGGEVLPYKRLMGMCRWMGLHFYDWIDYNGVTFSMEVLEWGHTLSDFWGGDCSSYLRLANVSECLYCRRKVKWSHSILKMGQFMKIESESWDGENYIFAQK